MARPESLRKFAMLWLGTLKSPKLWNRFAPPPGLVPPVMSYWVCPPTEIGPLTWVFRPDGVMGGAAWARGLTTASASHRQHTTVTPKVGESFVDAEHEGDICSHYPFPWLFLDKGHCQRGYPRNRYLSPKLPSDLILSCVRRCPSAVGHD